MHVYRNNEAPSNNHCWSRKAIKATWVYVFVALGIQRAMRMRHIVFLQPAPLYNIFLHYLIQGMIFGEKNVTEHKMCVSRFCVNFVRNVYHSAKSWARYDRKCIWCSCTAGVFNLSDNAGHINNFNDARGPLSYILRYLEL